MSRVLSWVLLSLMLLSLLAPSISATARASSLQPPGQSQAALPGFRYAGQVSGDTPVVGVIYVPLRNLDLLYYYAQAVDTPGSPLYHHFLTRQQVQELFYPTPQFEQALSYVQSHGLRVLFTAADSMIVFQGSASQVERSLNVTIGLFTNGTASYYAVTSVRGWLDVYASNATALLYRRFQVTLGQIPRPNTSEVYSGIEAYPLTQVVNAYNVSPLYSQGYYGQGVSVGVLDFYGDPTVAQDLAYYDQLLGLPPANLTIVPIGPYDPNLGLLTGWSYEIELDVESVQTAAPRAHIVLYVANGALPLAPVIAYIDNQDAVSIVTQSFGMDESSFSWYGAGFFYYNVYLTDVYYALGSAEGITFLASSGDGGGMGYSAGPVGGASYPASSPWVLSIGGTTTYVSGNEALQTAWSAAGFVPYMYNFGGSTGGYSDVEPMPWWQGGVVPQPPQGFPYGRATPDVSANANIFPGIIQVTQDNVTIIDGGTSEASPLTAGLLALVESRLGQRLGLLAPTLYWLYGHGGSSAFEPITFGYNIPWTINGAGYNLVTGLGAVNAGELAHELLTALPAVLGLSVEVSVNSSSSMLLPGQTYVVEANVTYPNGTKVMSGSLTVELETVYGPALTANMRYNSTLGLWVATFTAPSNASGIAFVLVKGSSGKYSGVSFTEVYLGYFATVLYPWPDVPWDPGLGLPVEIDVTLLNGTAVSVSQVPVTIETYDLLTNTYSVAYSNPSFPVGQGVTLYLNNLSPGYALLVVGGPAYAFVPFYSGSGLQDFILLPEDFGMPGVVSPGQYMFIEGYVMPPVQTYSYTSYSTGYSVANNVEVASNVTALLVAPNGTVISSTGVLLNSLVSPPVYEGFLEVPPSARPGYYRVLLVANYSSFTLGVNIVGVGLDMVYVAEPLSVVAWTVPSYPAQGQPVTIYANITYENGTPVRFGDFSATLVPEADYQAYWQYALQLFSNVLLYYNSTLGLWVGQATLPSPYSPGYTTFNGLYAGEPWVAVISGTGAFNPIGVGGYNLVIPETKYVFYAGVLTPGSFYPYDAVFYDVNITGFAGPIEGSAFEGYTYLIGSNVTLVGDNVTGTLYVVDSNVTLVRSTARNVVLVNGTLNLFIDDVVSSVSGKGKVLYIVPTEVYLINSSLAKAVSALSNLTRLEEQVNETYEMYLRLSSYLAGNVSLLEARVSQLNSTVLRYYKLAAENISSLRLSVSALSSNVTGLSDLLGRDYSSLLSLISNVNSTLVSEVSQMNSYLSSNVTALSGRLEDLASSIKSVNSTLEGEISNLGLELSGVNSTLSTEVSELRTNLNSVDSSLSSYIGRVSSQVQQINATYSGLYAGLRGSLESLQVQVSNLSTQVSQVRTGLSTKANASLADLGSGVGGLALVVAAVAVALVVRRR